MRDDVIVGDAAADIGRWLLTDARIADDVRDAIAGLGRLLIEAGVPVWRMSWHLPHLHPQSTARIMFWYDDRSEVEEITPPREVLTRSFFHHSVVGLMYRTGDRVRRRLVGPDAQLDYELLEQLRDQGATDYAMMPVPTVTVRDSAIGLTSKAPDGFSDADLALIDALIPALACLFEVLIHRWQTRELLKLYVGHNAAERILHGQITLGASRSIDAVLLIADMRGFSGLSETMRRDELLEMLNTFFAVLVAGIDTVEGEVLKYLGDGLLAILPLGEGEQREEACARGLIAAIETVKGLTQRNAERVADGQRPIHAGIALHVGSVLYGNIGAGNRLDFTVIGPAVNKATRIEAMCAPLGRRILTSADFAAASPVRLVPVGRHVLKGVSAAEALYTPAYDGST